MSESSDSNGANVSRETFAPFCLDYTERGYKLECQNEILTAKIKFSHS